MTFKSPSRVENLRTIRHRENKRRYRARQREYIESLQRRLAETRDQQVAGMREVQLAAQKVVNDNSRLRTLLRFVGVEDTVVESWLRGVNTPATLLPVNDATSPRSLISKPPALNNVSVQVLVSSPFSTKLSERFPINLPKHAPIYCTYHHPIVPILVTQL